MHILVDISSVLGIRSVLEHYVLRLHDTCMPAYNLYLSKMCYILESLADKLLCLGLEAKCITSTMEEMWPEYNWLGLTQQASTGWAASYKDDIVYLHTMRNNLCGKNLLLFRIAGPEAWSSGGCDASAAPAAQDLIDTALSLEMWSTVDTRDYILNSRICKARKFYSIMHFF